MLIINDICSQQNLNTPKEKLRIKPSIKHRPIVAFSFGEWFVEKSLRKHDAVYKEIKFPFIKSTFFQPLSNP